MAHGTANGDNRPAMPNLATPPLEPRIARGVVVAALLGVVAMVAFGLVREEPPRVVLDADELAHAERLERTWRAIANAPRHCPRPPLRGPATGDGSALLAGLRDARSPEALCLAAVGRHEDARCAHTPCPAITIASTAAPPGLLASCAPLYDAIAKLATTSAACSPEGAATFDEREMTVSIVRFSDAVRIQIGTLVAGGDLEDAARRVIDAVRFADDYGRHAVLYGAMIARALGYKLTLALDEILVDPRLTTDGALGIARDLDVVLASSPEFRDVVRAEAHWIAMRDLPYAFTGDPVQDRALLVLGQERWLRTYDEACHGRAPAACVEALAASAPPETDAPWDHGPALRELDRARARDRIVDEISATYHRLASTYVRAFHHRWYALTVARMQAELRTLDLATCRDAARRREHLARWLVDGLTLDAAAWTVQPPAWLRTNYQPAAARTLRCI